MSEKCRNLHRALEELPEFHYPFRLSDLPDNGIYFFYEKGESWGHGGIHPRIVRVGTHKNGNFRSRISEHFLPDKSKMNFTKSDSAPKDRSIFRKNLGRALIRKDQSGYEEIWEIDFTLHESRSRFQHLREISTEKYYEALITKTLRENFSFRFIILDSQQMRMGSQGLESALIGTLAKCENCRPSANWLGNFSPKKEIRESGLWLVQHLKAPAMNDNDLKVLTRAIKHTKNWCINRKDSMIPDVIEI